jgi:uncharacterized protein YdbL (DUF1318 family)
MKSNKSTSLTVWGIFASTLFLFGCSPTIKVATPEPVKIDVNMRVDVYSKEKKADEVHVSEGSVDQKRRLRMTEVQNLKNDRVIGESREGYLTVLKPPTDPKYASYAKSVVDAENTDRQVLYSVNAQKQGKPLAIIEREYAQTWSANAFPGEMIQKEDGSWIAK